MKKIIFPLSLLLFIMSAIPARPGDLPIKEWNTTSENPFVLYISGDGGFNNFSTGLCTAISKAGFSITAINAKSYFWSKKTPEQAANDIGDYLEKKLKERKNKQIVLAGYSFGADVIPFIANKLPDSLKKNLLAVVLLSPSSSTDFEIHWTDILGWNKKRNMDVVAGINKMNVPKTVTIFGSDEDDFPVKDIKLVNYNNEILPGGHHLDGDTGKVAGVMVKYFK